VQQSQAPFNVVGEAVAGIVHLDAGVVKECEHGHVLEDGVGALTIAHGMKVHRECPQFVG